LVYPIKTILFIVSTNQEWTTSLSNLHAKMLFHFHEIQE